MKWSRDFFKMARAAALKLASIDMDMQSRHDALMLQAQQYSDMPHGSGDLDPQAAIDAYIDAEMAAEAARVPLVESLNDATEVLYGPHARGGVAKLLGSKYADIICWRWLQLRRWREIARDLGVTVRWCQLCEQTAFDWMDEVGESHIRAYNDGEQEFVDSLRMERGR